MRAVCSVTVQVGMLSGCLMMVKVRGPPAARDIPPARNPSWISLPPVVPQLEKTRKARKARDSRNGFFISVLPLQGDLQREEDDSRRRRGEVRGGRERRIFAAPEIRGVKELAERELLVGQVGHHHAGFDRTGPQRQRGVDL